MKCQARISNFHGLAERECRRKTEIGIFCTFHIDYKQQIKKKIEVLKQELKRIERG